MIWPSRERGGVLLGYLVISRIICPFRTIFSSVINNKVSVRPCGGDNRTEGYFSGGISMHLSAYFTDDVSYDRTK